MLTRQKTILYMLKQAQRPVSRMELMKWCFLLKMETPSQGGSSFYQFVPYRYGPFSFCLYRDAAKLVEMGALEQSSSKTWRIAPDHSPEEYCLSPDVTRDTARTVRRFNSKSVGQLLEYVYGNYPCFTVNSISNPQQSRPIAKPGVYTAGYQGLQIDGFLNLLLQAGIEHVIDIRKNPVARRYGFHKSTLMRLCKYLTIDYVHLPQLGIPSQYRRSLRHPADYQRLFRRYESEILPHERESVAHVISMVQNKPCVLICMEADPASCHRSILAQHISAVTALPIHDLGKADGN